VHTKPVSTYPKRGGSPCHRGFLPRTDGFVGNPRLFRDSPNGRKHRRSRLASAMCSHWVCIAACRASPAFLKAACEKKGFRYALCVCWSSPISRSIPGGAESVGRTRSAEYVFFLYCCEDRTRRKERVRVRKEQSGICILFYSRSRLVGGMNAKKSSCPTLPDRAGQGVLRLRTPCNIHTIDRLYNSAYNECALHNRPIYAPAVWRVRVRARVHVRNILRAHYVYYVQYCTMYTTTEAAAQPPNSPAAPNTRPPDATVSARFQIVPPIHRQRASSSINVPVQVQITCNRTTHLYIVGRTMQH
jgi:hypothetical protein